MAYFTAFPVYDETFTIKDVDIKITVKDVTQNINTRKRILKSITLFDYYDVLDTDTPESLANQFYGSSNLHWIIMLMNDKTDYVNDFPMSSQQVYSYAIDKYGADKLSDVHHYEDAVGNVRDQYEYQRNDFGSIIIKPEYQGANIVYVPVFKEVLGLSAVSNLEYEMNFNEAKRRIKVIQATALQPILSQLGA